MKRRPACMPCSTRCCRHRGSRRRVSVERHIAVEKGGRMARTLAVAVVAALALTMGPSRERVGAALGMSPNRSEGQGAPSVRRGTIPVMILDGESAGPYHDWQRTTPVLKRILDETGLIATTVVTAPPAGADFSSFAPT